MLRIGGRGSLRAQILNQRSHGISFGGEPCPKTQAAANSPTPQKMPKHPRDIADLAALVLSSFKTDDAREGNRTLMIFVWRDCAMTVKFPSGRKNICLARGGQTLDSTRAVPLTRSSHVDFPVKHLSATRSGR